MHSMFGHGYAAAGDVLVDMFLLSWTDNSIETHCYAWSLVGYLRVEFSHSRKCRFYRTLWPC